MNKYKCMECARERETIDLPVLVICGACQAEMVLYGIDVEYHKPVKLFIDDIIKSPKSLNRVKHIYY